MTTSMDDLVQQVAALRDLFQRRLMEDRDKRQLYEQLAELVALARSDLERQFPRQRGEELVLLLDGIEVARQGGTQPADIVQSIHDEILEILARRLIEPVTAHRQPFDPAWHEAVGQTDAGPAKAGLVVEERRAGWRFNGALLRPARVVVGAAAEPDQDGGG